MNTVQLQAKPMFNIIQKLTAIENIDYQIDGIKLENKHSDRIAPRKEKRDRLLKEAFSLLGRIYYKNARWTPPDQPSESEDEPGSSGSLPKLIESIQQAVFKASNRLITEEDAIKVATFHFQDYENGAGDRETILCEAIEEMEKVGEINTKIAACSQCGESSLFLQSSSKEQFSVKCYECGKTEIISSFP